MLSQTLVDMLNQMEAMHRSETQLEAVHDLREMLEVSARHQACLRCKKASHMAIWSDQSKDRQQHCWAIIQTGCGAYLSLPPNGEAGFGFSLAAEPATVFYCSSEVSGEWIVADSAALGSRARDSGDLVAEVERVRPRSDADRG